MSGAPKRPHEESAGHATPSKRPMEDTPAGIYSSPAGKPTQPAGSDFHLPYELENRFSKAPRIENRDEKRTPPPPPFLMHKLIPAPSSTNSPLADPAEPKIQVKTAKEADMMDPPVSNKPEPDTVKEGLVDHSSKGGDMASHLVHHRATIPTWNFAAPPPPATDEPVAKTGPATEERDSKDGPINNNINIISSSNNNNNNNNNSASEMERKKKEEKQRVSSTQPVGTSNEPVIKKEALNALNASEKDVQGQSPGSVLNTESPVVGERKREREVEMGERQEKRNRYGTGEKEEGEGITGGAAGAGGAVGTGGESAEKEKEGFGGVQQRRRMLRSRGTAQAGNREPRFRSRMRDSDGSQGKGEASAIIYKAGECMLELLKSWKEFESSQDPKNPENLQNGPTLEIRIPAEYVTSTNRQVKGAQLWGTDIYTNDSDLVAVLMHTGYCSPASSPPPSAIQELRATIRVLPPQNCYTSTLRNNVRSRAWGAGIACSYRVERCCIVKKGGGTIDLEPRLNHASALEPTLAPVSVERTMTTRAAASNALRQQKFVREVTVQYNLCNEPWLKYSINAVADKGLKKSQYTSARLKRGEVLYLETHFNRYELCYNGEKSSPSPSRPNPNSSSSNQATSNHHHHNHHHHHHQQNQNGERHSSGEHREDHMDSFRFSRCKKALPESIMRPAGIPLPAEHVEVLEENLEWEDVQWSQNGVWIAGKEYSLARVHFLSPR